MYNVGILKIPVVSSLRYPKITEFKVYSSTEISAKNKISISSYPYGVGWENFVIGAITYRTLSHVVRSILYMRTSLFFVQENHSKYKAYINFTQNIVNHKRPLSGSNWFLRQKKKRLIYRSIFGLFSERMKALKPRVIDRNKW